MARGGKRPGAGRPPLAKNKIPMAAKAMIEQVAMGLGGAERMLTWVQEDPANEKAFWTAIYPKLLPLQVQGDKESPLRVVTSIRLEAMHDDSIRPAAEKADPSI